MKELPSFDELVEMNRLAPDKLEALRLELIDEVIQSAPEEKRLKLRGLQFRIDAQRKLAKNPMDAAIRISNMMKESFTKLSEALNTLQDNTRPKVKSAPQEPAKGVVLNLKKPGEGND